MQPQRILFDRTRIIATERFIDGCGAEMQSRSLLEKDARRTVARARLGVPTAIETSAGSIGL